MEKLELINGNGNKYELDLPRLLIKGYINDGALERIKENTDLEFKKTRTNIYEAKPMNSQQIVKFLLTYNFQYTFYNNYDIRNTIIFEYKKIGLEVSDLKEGSIDKLFDIAFEFNLDIRVNTYLSKIEEILVELRDNQKEIICEENGCIYNQFDLIIDEIQSLKEKFGDD